MSDQSGRTRSPEDGWRSMDEPVADAMRIAGPHGAMEFSEDMTAWRMLMPDGTVLIEPARTPSQGQGMTDG